MRGLGEAGYGVLQGTLGAIPGVSQFVDPIMEKGRVALQDATGASEEDIIYGEVISSIGNITGSLVTGNPKAALGQADEVADILESVGPTDNPENETRKNLNIAANYINTAGTFLPMLSGQIGKNKTPKGTMTGVDADGMEVSINPGYNDPDLVNYMYGGRKRYGYGGGLSQPVKLMTYPHNQMIMNNGGYNYADFMMPGVPVQGVAASNYRYGGKMKLENGGYPPEFLEAINTFIDIEEEGSASGPQGYVGGGSNYGTNDPSIKTREQAIKRYYDDYWSEIKDLPPGVRTRALQLAINTGDPYGELLVASGDMTIAERIKLKDEAKKKGLTGYDKFKYITNNRKNNLSEVDEKGVSKLDKLLVNIQNNPAEFSEKLDEEQRRYYNEGLNYGKNPQKMKDFHNNYYGKAGEIANKYYATGEKPTEKQDTKTVNTTSVSEDDINAAKNAGVQMINTDDLTGRELELAESENKTRAAKFKNNPADPSIPTKELIPTSEEGDPSRSTYYSPERRNYTADRVADSRDKFFLMKTLQQMNPDKSSEDISKMADDLLGDRGTMDAYSSFMGLPSYFNQGQTPTAPGPVTEPTEPEGDEGFTPIPVPSYQELMQDMPEEEIVIEDLAEEDPTPPEEEISDYRKDLENALTMSWKEYKDQKISENHPNFDDLPSKEKDRLERKYLNEYNTMAAERPDVSKSVITTKLRPNDKVPITDEIQADMDATIAAGGTVGYDDEGNLVMEAGKSGEGFSGDVITGEGTEDEDAATTAYNYDSPLTGIGAGTADAGTEVKESIYPWALAGTQAGYNILAPILAKKFRGEDYVEDPSYMDAIDYDLSEERRELQREVAGARKNLKNISGGNAGAYLTNLGSMYDRFRRGVAGSYARENLLETQANMEVDKYNKMLDAQRARDIGAINYSEDAQRRANILAGTTAAFEGMQTPFQNRITEQAGINFVNASLGPNSPYRMSYVPIGEQWRRRKNDTT